ncbi:4-hydroxy-2-oxoglutarate aldolase, mitochondrial-like isoform X2 [Homalodisca vitripennis]|uniref:4-hydroxy-2-oxoglutarate aldolase, mitochondrial-like isoform X2 n=1 Tax=Homalodisca vitripennis TaxID=197043 RepID=UPI001EEAE8FB|nr:4-hydroxy-2-oxoglutarate aldolase, mitochondrial-like isoform X2 [Homalodisca vitripennis]
MTNRKCFMRNYIQIYNSMKKLPFSGYLINGSNGEVAALSIEERLQILRHVHQNVDRNRLLLANAYCESTKQCCEITKLLASNGADAVLVLIPFYHRRSLNEDAILAHFRTVADSSPVPVVIYNNPGVTNLDISTQTILKLAEHPNICGVKEDNVSKIAELMGEIQNKKLNFEVTQSSGSKLLQSLVVGACGGMVSLPNILGDEVCQLYKLYKENKLEEAAKLQYRLASVDTMDMRKLQPKELFKGLLNQEGFLQSPRGSCDTHVLSRPIVFVVGIIFK